MAVMQSERVTPAAKIITECGVTALAKELGHSFPSKVSNWKQSGKIPVDEIPNVIKAARKLGKRYEPNDFFDIGDA
jgi:hypothetical protein